MSLLDTLLPASPPPAPKNARILSPLDQAEERIEVNNKAASLRALLRDSPEGMDYDQLSKHTGIARDKIAAHVAGLMTSGDAKKYMDGDRVFFKFSGDPARVGSRLQTQQPSPKPAAGLTEFNTRERETKPVAPPVPTSAPKKDAEPVRAAVPKAAAPQAPETGRPGSDRASAATAADPIVTPAAAAAPTERTKNDERSAQTEVGKTQTAVATGAPAAASQDTSRGAGAGERALRRDADALKPGPWSHAEPKRREQLDLMTELTIVAAANLATEARDLIAAADIHDDDAFARALRNFERADRLREEIKAERAV